MKAVIVSEYGGPEVLKLSDVADPSPQRGEALVKVMATALNRADILQRKGQYPAPKGSPAAIPGLEFAGVVDDIAEDVDGVIPGDRVFGLTPGGSYAQYVVVHQRTLAKIPDNLSFTEAAAVPEAFVTAYDAMVQGRFRSGEWLLVHAVGSGVGTAALQLCDALGGRCVGTSRTQDKLDRAKQLGLEHGVLVSDNKFADQVNRIVGPDGVDLVLELVGGSYVTEDLECLSSKGRIIVIGLLAGAKVELNLARLLSKRIHMIGTTLRARPLEEKIVAARLLSHNIAPLLESGKVKPIIDKVFPIDQVEQAHRYVEGNDSFGKVVLTM